MVESTYVLRLTDVANQDPAYLETIFALANGRFGLRAGDVLTPSATAGTIVNGFYETAPIQYGESAYGYATHHQTTNALPDLRVLQVETQAGVAYTTAQCLDKTLHLDTGVLEESWLAQASSQAQLKLNLVSVLQQPCGQTAALTYTLEALDTPQTVTIKKNLVMPGVGDEAFDPRKAKAMTTIKLALDTQTTTRLAGQVRAENGGAVVPIGIELPQGLQQTVALKPGKPVSFTVLATVGEADTELDADAIQQQSAHYWQHFWAHSDVDLDGDDQLARALHYNLFQLAASAGQNGKTNIAAKGLSGTGYEGHYFWDTEMYMLPFLTYTNPQIAKQLLRYRASVLPQAKARARILGVDQGALFAWRTINGEEASAYYPAGTAQYHIDADIAYAVNRYYVVTQDRDFMASVGLELMVETARFWAAFGQWNQQHTPARFEFFDVTGPDEYTAIVNNNYYTNRMAKFNLQAAAKLCAQFADSAKALNVTAEELATWQKAAAAVYLPFDEKRGIHMQDDSAFSKPVWPFETTPKDHYPLLLHYHPLTIYRYQVNKQADTLLADYLFDDVPAAQLAREYAYYESITTHDSSLSRSIFSALAARLGDDAKAYRYFMDTAQMDLIDLQRNAADGLHIANLGGSWLSVATGFGGVAMKNGQLQVTNHLPKAWTRLSLRLTIAGRLLMITYRPGQTDVAVLSGDPLTVVVDGQPVKITRKD